MILNINDSSDSKYINNLQKARGIKLISKYLPNLCVQKQVYIVNTIDEWNIIKDRLPEIVTIRTDNRIGMEIPEVGGSTCEKADVEKYMINAINKVEEPYFLCMELEQGTGERIDTQGGFCIDSTIGGLVHIGYTGQCFDCRELTKGKAEHETWQIPWNDLMFIKPNNHRKYHTQTISQDTYKGTAIERMKFLIDEYPKRKDEIIRKMPKKYKEVKPYIMENLIEQVLIPLYLKRNNLLNDGLDKFDVELNVLEDGRLIPFELCRPERFIVKKKEHNER